MAFSPLTKQTLSPDENHVIQPKVPKKQQVDLELKLFSQMVFIHTATGEKII